MASERRRREVRRLWDQAAALSVIATLGYEAVQAQWKAAKEADRLAAQFEREAVALEDAREEGR